MLIVHSFPNDALGGSSVKNAVRPRPKCFNIVLQIQSALPDYAGFFVPSMAQVLDPRSVNRYRKPPYLEHLFHFHRLKTERMKGGMTERQQGANGQTDILTDRQMNTEQGGRQTDRQRERHTDNTRMYGVRDSQTDRQQTDTIF